MHPGNKTVRAAGHVSGRFAVGTAIAEKLPAGPLLEDLAGPFPLEPAVVPFEQIGIDFRAGTKASQLACPGSALQGTGEDMAERKPTQLDADLACVLLATFIERQVRSAGFLMRIRPCRVAMPSEKESR